MNKNVEVDTTNFLIKEMEKYPILPAEEQLDLIKRYQQQNDKEAYLKLYNHSLRLLVHVAKMKLKKCTSMQLEDLIQENSIILMEAIEKYNPELGTAFSTYAIEYMKNNLEREISKKDESVRIPYKQNSNYRDYKKFSYQFQQKYHRLPTTEEIKQELNFSDKIMNSILLTNKSNTVSLNTKLSTEDSDSQELESLIADENDPYNETERKYDELILLQTLKDNLTTKEYYVIYNRIIEKPALTLEALGKDLNLSITSVQNIEKKALQELKGIIKEKQSETLKKYNIDELKQKNFKPLSPLEITYMHFLKGKLSNLLYHIIFNKKFNPQNDNLQFYQRRFPLYNISDIKEEMNFIEEFLKDLRNKEEKSENIYKAYKKTKTISQIFELDIKPEKQEKKYLNIMSYFQDFEYQDIEQDEYIRNLDEKSKKLLQKYFEKNKSPRINQQRRFSMIERYINLTLLNYGKSDSFNLNKKEIEQLIEENRGRLTQQDLDYINYYFFNKPNEIESKDMNTYSSSYYKNKLLKLKFNIDHFFELQITKEQIISVEEKYPDFLTKTEQYIINKYYGINEEKKSLEEISLELDQSHSDITRLESYLRIKILKKYYNIGMEEKDIDSKEFLKYITNPRYEFTSDMRKIMKLYISDKKSLSDISKILELSSTKVSNNLNEGIRAANMYRYGIKKILIMSEEDFNNLIKNNNYSALEKRIIYEHYILNKTAEEISKNKDQTLKKVKDTLKEAYNSYLLLKVPTLTDTDYEFEVNTHISDSILTEEERNLTSLSEGIKSKYNKTGRTYTKEEIKKEYQLEDRRYRHKIEIINQKIRERKCKLKAPKYGIMSKEEIENILKIPTIPITEREKEILLDLKEINTEESLSEEEIAKKYNLSIGSLKRRYNRIILSLAQYKNSIKKVISYDHQIKSIEKYFSDYDRKMLILFYKEHLTVTEISKKLNITFDQTNYYIQQLQIKVKSILNNEKTACCFDFDYARTVIDKTDLPLYQNRELSIKIYKMLTGEDGIKKHSTTDVMQTLNLNCTIPVITKAMYDVMIAVEKYKLGERRITLVTEEEVLEYYQDNIDKLTKTTKKRYERYLKNRNNQHILEYSIPQKIIYEILKERQKLIFDLSTKSKKDMIEIIRKKSINLSSEVISAIKKYYQIEEKIFMSGKEKIKALKLLEPLYLYKKTKDNQKKIFIS